MKLFVVAVVVAVAVAVAVCFCFGAGGGPVSFGVGCETGLQPEHAREDEVWPGGDGRLHPGGCRGTSAEQERRDGRPGHQACHAELTGDDKNFVVTTDLGNEFATLDRELPAEAVHRTKRPEDRNATAVVDRRIQTLKKDLAMRVARKGGQWSHFEQTASAYNARPHETVHGAPEDVEKQPATEFRVLQDNADRSRFSSPALRRSHPVLPGASCRPARSPAVSLCACSPRPRSALRHVDQDLLRKKPLPSLLRQGAQALLPVAQQDVLGRWGIKVLAGRRRE